MAQPEQFIPAVMAALPLVRTGIGLIGRKRVVDFLATLAKQLPAAAPSLRSAAQDPAVGLTLTFAFPLTGNGLQDGMPGEPTMTIRPGFHRDWADRDGGRGPRPARRRAGPLAGGGRRPGRSRYRRRLQRQAPDPPGRPDPPGGPRFAELRADWLDVLSCIVRPALAERAAKDKLDQLVPRGRPPLRLCCLAWADVLDPGSLGAQGDPSEARPVTTSSCSTVPHGCCGTSPSSGGWRWRSN